MNDDEQTQTKQLEDQKRKQKEEENEDSRESEKLDILMEEYMDQILIEEESKPLQISEEEDKNEETSIEVERREKEEEISVELMRSTEKEKTEVNFQEEVEEVEREKEQEVLREEYEDQILMSKGNTEESVNVLQEEKISNPEEEEQLKRETENLLNEKYQTQYIISEEDIVENLGVKKESREHEIEKTMAQRENLEEIKSDVKNSQDINSLIKELNTQLETRDHLDSSTYRLLTNLHDEGTYPNIAFVYKRDGRKTVEQLNRHLYDKLIDNQRLGNFRLEWQRFWFEGLGQIEQTEHGRRIFLLDLSKEEELPTSMRRIFLAKNTHTWNTLVPTKRELHSMNIREFIDILFGKRVSSADFENVKDFTYQKKMNNVWREFQRVYKKDFDLKTTKRPALFALKPEYTRESIEHTLIGTFWKYYHGLDRIGRRNMKQWGYNNLLQLMKNKATGVYPTIVDPNYIGQKFVVRVVNKGRAFKRLLGELDEIKETDHGKVIDRIYQSWIIDNEILHSKVIDGLMWGVKEARSTHYIKFDSIAHLMNEKNTYGINAVLEAFFENKNVLDSLNTDLNQKFRARSVCTSSGYARINSGALSTAYPDLKIHTEKPINVQIKDLGKCFDQNKKELVIYDQFKSFFGKSDNFENITLHLINGVDLTSVYDVKSHPNLTQNNVGIITIGIWDDTEGINKFGELFSALRIAQDSGYTDKEAFDTVVKYIDGTGQSFDKTDENTLRKLQGLWSNDPANLILNVIEVFGDNFQETSVNSIVSDTTKKII